MRCIGTGLKTFTSQMVARDAIVSMILDGLVHRGSMASWPCPMCEGWHITRRPRAA